ncbi:hypothetical protein Bhyg_01920, partial [Pseudolycoriella hygida]
IKTSVECEIKNQKSLLELSKEVVNVTECQIVEGAESQKKFPAPSDAIQKLSEPRMASYIKLYNSYSNVLDAKTINRIKEKLCDYLQKIENEAIDNKREKEKKLLWRKKQKLQAKKLYGSNEYSRFSCKMFDALYEILSTKFKKCCNDEIPKPLVMASNSMKLYENIRAQIEELLKPRVDLMKGTKGVKVVDAFNPNNNPVTTDAIESIDIRAKVQQEARDGRMQTVETLSYFVMQFIKQLLLETLRDENKTAS